MKPRVLMVLVISFFLMGMVSIGALFLYEPRALLKPMPVMGEAPQFSLTDAFDRQFRSPEKLAGRVWVADFFFTSCAGPCPKMAAHMALLQRQYKNRSDFKLVSFSVDPKNDTPPELNQYAKKLGVDQGQWYFLTGSAAALSGIAHNGFKIGGEHLINHSMKFILVDRKGMVRGYYDGTSPQEVERLAADIRRLL